MISYAKNDFNLSTLLLQQFVSNNCLNYSESIFSEANNLYQPKNLAEAHFGKNNSTLSHRLNEISYPKDFSVFRVNTMAMPRHFYYPSSRPDKSLQYSSEGHFYRTINTYNSIKKNGYLTEIYFDGSRKNGYIRGIILQKKL